MAITVKTIFNDFSPVFNPAEVCLDSTNKALANFQYIIDVYIEGVASFERFYVDKEPALSYGAEDIGRYLEAYVTPTPTQYDSTGPFIVGANATTGQSIIKVTLKFGEKYGTPPVVYADLVTSSDYYFFGGILSFNEFLDWTPNDYLCNITNGSNAQFLTDMKTNYVSLNNLGWHHILSDTPTDIDSLVIRTYDSSDVLIATNIKSNTTTQVPTTARNYKVATGPESLNNMTGAWVSGGPNPIITASVAWYEIFLVNGAGTVASETLTFIMQEPCRYPQVRLSFLNKYYSFDYFNFELRSQKKRTNKKEGYKMDKYPIVTAGISRNHSDQAQVVNYVEVQETITVRSDYLTEEQYNWLKQLVESPDIYLQFTDGDGAENTKAIYQCTNTSWVEQSEDADKLFIIELEIEMSHKEYRQRR